jgi:hypothetical protein
MTKKVEKIYIHKVTNMIKKVQKMDKVLYDINDIKRYKNIDMP